jgi:non-specific serine/threonine protein kinase/serine/threonine-protein kinase
MSNEWKQVKQLFDRALEYDATQRLSFLKEACGDDETLYSDVSSLLHSYEHAGTFLERPLFQSRGDSPADGFEGVLIGSYRIVRRIGEGGMGTVYLATRADDEFQKKVAIKVVTSGDDDGQMLRRFLTERQTLAGLDHPNIVKLLDGGTKDGRPYFVMDYIEGQPIHEYCISHGLSIVERLQLFQQVCAAVHYAHQNLVVHRDVKPSNILVTPEGVPKLLDFGIAKLLKPEYSYQASGLTRTRVQPLTPAYASPEQIRGQPITTATDIYSLGVLLYRLLTEQHPFEAHTHSTGDIERAICDLDPELPSKAAGRQIGETEKAQPAKPKQRLSRELDMIVLMAMRKEPQRRYASVEHFSEDIRRHLAHLPVIACRDTARYRFGKFLKRHKAGVAAGTLLTLTLLVSTIVAVWYSRVAQAEKIRAERRFQDVRQLAEFMLFDFDDAMRSGATSARRRAVNRGFEAIRRLAQEAPDESLQRDLMEGYFRVGDLQGNLYGPNVGDLSGATESYRRALEVADTMYRKYPGNARAQRDFARANQKIGEVLALAGNHEAALHQYEKALAMFGPAGDSPDIQTTRDLMTLYERTGFTRYELGDLTKALENYANYLSSTKRLLAANPRDTEARRALARGNLRAGEIQASCGQIKEGLERVRGAVSIYQELAASDPTNAILHRDLASAFLILGDVLAQAGKRSEAIGNYREGLKLTTALQREDSENHQLQRDLYLTLGFLANLLAEAGQTHEAHQSTERALGMAKALAAQSQTSPDDHRNYAWFLLATPFKDLQNLAEAKRHAQLAVTLSGGNDPAVLHTLALAQEAAGELKQAIETEQSAINLLPRTSGGACVPHLWRELDHTLARLRAKTGAESTFPEKSKR